MAETTTNIAETPKVQANPNGTYHGIFLAPTNMEQRIPEVLNKMAETDTELATAIAEGKKTFKGCCRWLNNNMADLAREMKTRELTFDDESVHLMARYYMTNPDCLDVQNAVKEIKEVKEKKPKQEKKPKAEESKPKAEEKKPKKVMPINSAIGSLFGDEDFN